MIETVEGDPGTERKAMLFYCDGRELAFVRFSSEARVFVMELTEKIYEET